MRAFIALPLLPGEMRAVDELQEGLRALPPFSDFRWIPSSSIHMTLRFLGEISEEEAAAAASALDAVCVSGNPGAFSLARLGVFPKARNPGVLWAGPDHPPEGLLNFAKSLEKALEIPGFPVKQGFFRPHLTLARRRRSARPLKGVSEALKEAEKKWLALSIPIQPIEAVLFRSELLPGGAVYHAVHRAPFSNQDYR